MPPAYLRDLTHTFALCDRHLLRIVGKWYRCAFCAKDLCADCEELDTHDNTHVFLVFKAPVDMENFRCAVLYKFIIHSYSSFECSRSAEFSLIWKTRMVNLSYLVPSTTHDMINASHDSHCYCCPCSQFVFIGICIA